MAPSHDTQQSDSTVDDGDESASGRTTDADGERRDRHAAEERHGGHAAEERHDGHADGEGRETVGRGSGDDATPCARDGGTVPERAATDYPGATGDDADEVRLDGETVASVVSHDLRNPLDVAKANLQVARETGEDEYLEAVARAHDRMEEIIDDVLALARVGEVTDTEPVALATVAERAWSSVATDDAELRIEGPLPTAVGDADTLERFFENLFRNSVEHAGEAPTVCVGRLDATDEVATGTDEVATGTDATATGTDATATETAEEAPSAAESAPAVGFYVADDGPGIPVAERERVFESGYSADGTGTGLGLAIARRIVSAHGWSVAAVDGDGGARFEVTGLNESAAR